MPHEWEIVNFAAQNRIIGDMIMKSTASSNRDKVTSALKEFDIEN